MSCLPTLILVQREKFLDNRASVAQWENNIINFKLINNIFSVRLKNYLTPQLPAPPKNEQFDIYYRKHHPDKV